MTAPTIRPLRKRKPTGESYIRDPRIEEALRMLLLRPEDQIVERCAIGLRDLPEYVPTECLLYLVRTGFGRNLRTAECLFKLLAARVLRRLPPRSDDGSRTYTLAGSDVADEVFGNFMSMLNRDRQDYDERLDIFEIRFDMALKSLRLDGEKMIRRRERHLVPIDVDEKTGDVHRDLRPQVDGVPPFDAKVLERVEMRQRLTPAIEQLPELQRRILQLDFLGIPTHSEDPKVETIAKALGKSEKTIRTHRQLAQLALQPLLTGEKLP